MSSDWAIVAAGAVGVLIPTAGTVWLNWQNVNAEREASQQRAQTEMLTRLADASAKYETSPSAGNQQELKGALMELALTNPRARIRAYASEWLGCIGQQAHDPVECREQYFDTMVVEANRLKPPKTAP